MCIIDCVVNYENESDNCVVNYENKSDDCVVNYENESDFVIRDFIVPTNCVYPSHPNNHEISTGFCKFFSITDCNQSSNHGKIYSQKILCDIKKQ